ncbi:MAG TPA: metallophosphoesterase family protein [Anaerolineae bacterium]|nr:metallophosphoesterase family protein [Anaerolineae bacterium]
MSQPTVTYAVGQEASVCAWPTRGPYLQSATPDSIVIVWETSGLLDSVVEYGRTEACRSSMRDGSLSRRHAITLSGLSAHTTYHYRVKVSDLAWSPDGTLKTAAGPGQTSFSFAVIGDTHGGVYEFPRRKRDIDAAHRHAVDTIAALSPDFYLHLGDLVQDGGDLAAWDEFFAVQRQLIRGVPIFPALGNHERNHQYYFDLFYLPGNERWYSFDYGNAHFISLEVDGYADIASDGPQYRWLESDLAGTRQTWKFVFFHFPAYSGGDYGSDLEVQAYLVPLFRRYGVDIVFNGHEHNYQRNVVDGLTYLETSGGGGMIRPPGVLEWTVYSEDTRHVVIITIQGDQLDSVAIRLDGSRFDPFTLSAHQ